VETRLVIAAHPAAEILLVAQEIRCDLIVMGTHGRTGLGRMLSGSVAEEVLRRASCPVLTVKTPLPPAQSPEERNAEDPGQVKETRVP
jgi:nucleotide-binding universal stress UspA family protein